MKAAVPPALVTEIARASWCRGTSSDAYGPVTAQNSPWARPPRMRATTSTS